MQKKKIKEKTVIFLIFLILIINFQAYFTIYHFPDEISPPSIKDLEDDFFNPKIVRPNKIHDSNGDKIADTLSRLIREKSITNSPKVLRDDIKNVEVMICVNTKPDLALIKKFKDLGAEIISIYDKLIYAIAALVPIDKLSVIAADPVVTLIEKQAYSKAHLDTSTVNMGVRGSPYVWNASSAIKGNPYYSIAILDTGVDSSHSDMQNFLHFRDFTTHGYPNGSTGIDYGHHGTHCASIAAGMGTSDIDPNTVNQTIASQFHFNTFTYWTTHWFEVKDNLNHLNTSLTLDWDTSGGGSAEFYVRDSVGTIISPNGPYSTTPITYNLNLTLGWYQVVVYAEVAATCNKDYTITIEHEYKYILSNELANSPVFAGVAPQSKIVSLKVLDDFGTGTGNWFQNALNWISVNGKNPAYNITVVSMSLGFDGIYSSIDAAINNLVNEGFICVASAGNDGTYFGNNSVGSPGTAQKCITVGAVNDAFEITYYSSNGNATINKPDVVAPGGTIALSDSSSLHNLILAADSNYGEDYNSMSDVIANDYIGMQGTSMSCPHVAGLTQLVIDAIVKTEGSWTWSQENALRIKQIICMGTWEVNAGETLDWDGDGIPQNPPLNRVGTDVVEGFGMVRADAVIQSITNSTSSPFTNVPYYLDRRAGAYAKEHKVLLFSLDAIAGTRYTFTLMVPSTGDFDLIMYDNDYNSSTGTPIVNVSSINSGLGVDESLIFIPAENNTYYWSIRAVEGYGTCEVSMSQYLNEAPDTPINPSPLNGATGVNLNITLSVDVLDPNGDSLNVSFYNASDDSLIGTDLNVPSGGTASVSWTNLSAGTTYSWYAVANDSINATNSSIWSFTTDYAPNYPVNPIPFHGATGIGIPPTLSIDVFDADDDLLDVSFFDGSDDSLIGIDASVTSGSTASIIWFGLIEGTTHSWYVVVSDGILSNISSIWSFTIFLDIPIWEQTLTDQIIELGDSFVYHINATDLSGIILYWVNDTSNFIIDSNGVLSNITTLALGTYWLELRAYDPYGNYCDEIIKVVVEPRDETTDTTSPIIPGYNIVFFVCIISLMVHLVIRKQKNVK